MTGNFDLSKFVDKKSAQIRWEAREAERAAYEAKEQQNMLKIALNARDGGYEAIIERYGQRKEEPRGR